MNNQTELGAAIEWYKDADWGDECFEDGVVRGFQAGAAYQRQQDKGLVEALEMCVRSMRSVLPDFNPHDQAAFDMAGKALAAYRAAKGEKP